MEYFYKILHTYACQHCLTTGMYNNIFDGRGSPGHQLKLCGQLVKMLIAPEPRVICGSYLVYYTPNGYIVPMEFRVLFFPRISAFSRRTKMHLNGMLLIGTEFFKIIVPL